MELRELYKWVENKVLKHLYQHPTNGQLRGFIKDTEGTLQEPLREESDSHRHMGYLQGTYEGQLRESKKENRRATKIVVRRGIMKSKDKRSDRRHGHKRSQKLRCVRRSQGHHLNLMRGTCVKEVTLPLVGKLLSTQSDMGMHQDKYV